MSVAKKVKFESFVYRLLAEADVIRRQLGSPEQERWQEFVESLRFHYDRGYAIVSWEWSAAGSLAFSLSDPDFYPRGDSGQRVVRSGEAEPIYVGDAAQTQNAVYFRGVLARVATAAGTVAATGASSVPKTHAERLIAEEQFHDRWAAKEDPAATDVRKMNEACTSPEMRYIRGHLGALQGKRLLDVGCGLGEASVYFAMEGAVVTAMDISQGMLDATIRLARLNGVAVRTHKAAADETNLPPHQMFDVIYAGNLLHHVDIASTLTLLKPHLAPGGLFVSWDPVAYNPIINVYRSIATKVRTKDEHPLKWKDIRLFRCNFQIVTTKYFWLTTLFIFIVMALVQRRDPNEERFWKAVVSESDRWEPLYRPLSKLDSALLALFPPLRLLCWNVVIIARCPLK